LINPTSRSLWWMKSLSCTCSNTTCIPQNWNSHYIKTYLFNFFHLVDFNILCFGFCLIIIWVKFRHAL
jgi:hypothetical protein